MISSNMESTTDSRMQGGWNSLSSGLKVSCGLQDDSHNRGDSGLEFISLAFNHLLVHPHSTRPLTLHNTFIVTRDESG